MFFDGKKTRARKDAKKKSIPFVVLNSKFIFSSSTIISLSTLTHTILILMLIHDSLRVLCHYSLFFRMRYKQFVKLNSRLLFFFLSLKTLRAYTQLFILILTVILIHDSLRVFILLVLAFNDNTQFFCTAHISLC